MQLGAAYSTDCTEDLSPTCSCHVAFGHAVVRGCEQFVVWPPVRSAEVYVTHAALRLLAFVQFVGLNITGSYYNPSDTDDCPRYVEKTLLFLIQVCGWAICADTGLWWYMAVLGLYLYPV